MDNYLIELGGVKTSKGYFNRNQFVAIDETFDDEVIAFIDETDNTEAYYTIYAYQNENIDSCLLYAPLYIDLDFEIEKDSDFRMVARDTLFVLTYLVEEFKIPEEMIELYFSGSKGFHIIVDAEIIGIEPSVNLNEDLLVLAQDIAKNTLYKTVDTGIYDRRRLFRFPNSINAKTGLYKVPITPQLLRTMDYEGIKAYASEPKEIDFREAELVPEAKKKYQATVLRDKLKKGKRKKKAIGISSERKDLLPCVQNILESGAGKGSRNNTTVAVASSMIQSGIPQDEVLEELLMWNEKNDPPLSDREIMTTVRSAYSLVQSGRGYGCRFFQDQGHCVGAQCPLFKG